MQLLNWLICAAMHVPCPSRLGVDVAVVPGDGLLDPVRAHLPGRDPSFVWAPDPGPGRPVRGAAQKDPWHEPGEPVGSGSW
jgi:hypothetical protein